ncbi:MAG: HIT domain-containing protein [Bdellovibrionales bacterium]|nr:HIT domain-containing protein [Bdellovibrionales bacterium]
MERDIVVRPERMRYVRRMIKTKGCVFCEAAITQDRDERHVLLRSRNAMVILNKYPYNSGHLLVLPLRHEGELPNLEDQEFQELNLLVRESVRLLKAEYHCEGLNVGLNLGAAAGAGIPEHLHYHIIPRWFGDTNFFPLIAETKLTVETPEQTYSRLKAAFLKLEKELK